MKTLTKIIRAMCLAISSLIVLTACNPSNIKESENPGTEETEDILQSTGLSADSVEEALTKAEKALQSGKIELAQLYYIKAYSLEPNNTQVLQKMADLYINIKKYDLAEVSFNLILKQQPDDLKTLEQYGLLLINMRNYPKAENYLNRVIAKQQNWRAYNGLGIIANLQGNALKAEALFKKANNLLPNSPDLLNNIGFALYSANKLDEAATYYLKALQINPGFKKAIYNYGLVQARLSRYEQAYTAFTKIASPAEANNNIGYIAMMNGDYTEANNYLQEAIQSAPEFYKKANDNLMRLDVLQKQ